MELARGFTSIGEGLNNRDFEWMMRTLRGWLTVYVHAEATVANRKLSHDELRNFMLEKETPSERYWD